MYSRYVQEIRTVDMYGRYVREICTVDMYSRYARVFRYVYTQQYDWLVVGPPLWKIWTSIGMIIPNIWEKIENGIQTTNQTIWVFCTLDMTTDAPFWGRRWRHGVYPGMKLQRRLLHMLILSVVGHSRKWKAMLVGCVKSKTEIKIWTFMGQRICMLGCKPSKWLCALDLSCQISW